MKVKKICDIGPAGIHKCFRAKWDIDDPKVNIEIGVRALRGRDKIAVLKRYNWEYRRNGGRG